MKYFLFILLIGCGNSKDPSYPTTNDIFFNQYKEELINYIEDRGLKIEDSFKTRIRTFPISFSNNIEQTAVCRGNTQIYINSFYKDTNFQGLLKGIVFHELGHCVFQLPHYDLDNQDLMHSKPDLLRFNDDWIYRIEMGLY